MRGIWAGSLALGLLAGSARAQEVRWQPSPAAPVNAVANKPAASLGMPVAEPDSGAAPAPEPASSDPLFLPVSFNRGEQSSTVVRAQGPDTAGALAPPPGADERYNCGVVTDPPEGHHDPLFGSFGGFGRSVGGYAEKFRSDHCFDNFISPVSNPFLFEDPRSLTELRPIFIYQQAPGKNPVYGGGDILFAGTQARLAITDRWSVVMNKLGWIWEEPHGGVPGFDPHTGFAEIDIGPKFTFLRSETWGTVAAVGATFQIPIGDTHVYQDVGTLSIVPYVSVAQNFLRSSYGSFNAMNTTGYAFSTDDKRSEYLFTSFHLDYDILNAHRIYPLIELSYFYYAQNGKSNALDFEGRDLINFGATSVSGNSYFLLAAGFRYKFNEHVQVGLAGEVPLNGRRDIEAFRINADMIFRW